MVVALGLLVAVVITSNAGDDDVKAGTFVPGPVPTAPPQTTTTTVPTTTTIVVVRYPSGVPVLPGYPLIVPIGQIDRRVASWLEDHVIDGQVVAVAPGVYRAFNPAVPTLSDYIDGPNAGDCLVRKQYYPEAGGTCWDGVQKSPAEP